MKIAIFTDLYLELAGGIPSVIKTHQKIMTELGHQVVIFCPGFHCSESNVFLVPTHPILKPNGAPLAKRPSVIEKKILANIPDFSNFDIIHVHHELSCSIAGIRLAKKFNIPLVQTMHGREDAAITYNIPKKLQGPTATILNFIHHKILPHTIKSDSFSTHLKFITNKPAAKMWELMTNHANQADIIITPSEHFKNKLQSTGTSKPIIAIPSGSNYNQSITQSIRILKPNQPINLIWCSRVSKEKRITVFIEALSKVKIPYQFFVFGTGNELDRAKKMVSDQNLQNIFFFGQKTHDEIYTKMNECHLSIMASYDFDTQGMTIMESKATGLPILFCDPDMQEFIQTGEGVLTSQPDADGFTEALEFIYHNADIISDMSKNILKNNVKINAKQQVIKTLKVYSTLIEYRRSRSC